MRVLLDTNIVLRIAQPSHPMHSDAAESVRVLIDRGDEPCIVPQNLYESWVVCTRPTDQNGFGMSVTQTGSEIQSLRTTFTLLRDTPAILPEWERLVTTYSVLGKNAHDARLAAAAIVHSVEHLLTFNDKDFRRFTELTILTPQEVLASTS